MDENEKSVHSTRSQALADIKDNSYHAGWFEIFTFACGIVLGGSVSSWNAGYHAGFGSFLLSTGVMTIGYICLVCCLGELTSITAFAGGNYGYARCSIGPMYGYLFACFEWGKNSVFTLYSLQLISEAFTFTFDISSHFEPLGVFLLYLVLVVLLLPGGSIFWRSMYLTAFLSIVLLMFFLLSNMIQSPGIYETSSAEVNHKYHGFHQREAGFMQSLIYAGWFYIGIESITVAGAKIGNGPEIIPKAMIAALALFIIIAFWMINIVYFGYLQTSNYQTYGLEELFESKWPMIYGWKDHYPLTLGQAMLLSCPSIFGSALAWFYSSINVFHAMSLSGLFLPYFQVTVGKERKVPVRAIVASLGIQYCFYLFLYFLGFMDLVLSFTLLGASFSYIGTCIAFLMFRSRFPSMIRKWTAPFGMAMAFTGIFVFTVVIISIVGYHPKNYIIIPFLAGFLGLFMAYYFAIAEKMQFFSHEEQEKFFKAYIMNANLKKKKKGKASTGSKSSSRPPNLWSALAGSAHSALLGNISVARSSSVSTRTHHSQFSSQLKHNRIKPAEVPIVAMDMAY